MSMWRNGKRDAKRRKRLTTELHGKVSAGSTPAMLSKPVFLNCNVCGRGLVRDDELKIGMCVVCANE